MSIQKAGAIAPAFSYIGIYPLSHPNSIGIDPVSVRGVAICVHRPIGAQVIPLPGGLNPPVCVHRTTGIYVVPLVVPLNPSAFRHGAVRLHKVPLVAGFQPNLHDGCSVVVEVVPVAISIIPSFEHLIITVKVVGLSILEGF